MEYTVKITLVATMKVEADDVAEAFDIAKSTEITRDMLRLDRAATRMKDALGNNIDVRNFM